ncbi:MAG: hypothetical protein WBK28_04040 [Minisyncoccia bacterium]
MELGKFTYLAYMLVFCLPVLALMWGRKWRLLWANRLVLAITTSAGVLWWFLAEPLVPLWKPWVFGEERILGVWFHYAPIEDLLYALLVPFTIASVVIIFLDSKRRGKRRFLFG